MTEKSEGEDLKKSTTIINFLEKSLECPVCLEVAKPPVQQCSRGHVVCCKCVNPMPNKVCPLCSKEFILETSTCLNNLLESLPRFCKYSTSGCKEVCVLGTAEEHEDYCGFRSITCRECKVKVHVCKMLNHYKDKHPRFAVFQTMQSRMTWKDFDSMKDRTSNSPLSIGGHFFYITDEMSTFQKELLSTCDAFYINKPETEYFVNFKYENGKFAQQKTIRPTVMKGDEDDGSKVREICESEKNIGAFRMSVPQEFLQHFITKDKSLINAYTLFTIKIC